MGRRVGAHLVGQVFRLGGADCAFHRSVLVAQAADLSVLVWLWYLS